MDLLIRRDKRYLRPVGAIDQKSRVPPAAARIVGGVVQPGKGGRAPGAVLELAGIDLVPCGRLQVDRLVGQPDSSIGKDRHSELYSSLHIIFERDKRLSSIRVDLRYCCIGLFEKDIVHAATFLVCEDIMKLVSDAKICILCDEAKCIAIKKHIVILLGGLTMDLYNQHGEIIRIVACIGG